MIHLLFIISTCLYHYPHSSIKLHLLRPYQISYWYRHILAKKKSAIGSSQKYLIGTPLQITI